MADLLAGLHDSDGRVTLPGFYDNVLPVSDAERALIARLPFDEKAWLTDAGNSGATSGEAGYGTLERVWTRPTAEINGMYGGHTGPGGKTIVPATAHAKLSFRLVANQEPADVIAGLRQYVREHTPPGIEASIDAEGAGVRPCFAPMDSAAVRAGLRAMERAFGQEILFTREGGSGPEADLADILDAPLVFIAVGLDADRIHAPNERVSTALLLKGAETAAYLWDELAAAGSRPDGRTVSAAAAADGAQPPPRATGRSGLGLTGTALTGLALSRAVVDRSAHLRADAAWLAAAWADPRTRVLPVQHGRALCHMADGYARLTFVSPGDAPDGVSFLLGTDAAGLAYFGVAGAAAGARRARRARGPPARGRARCCPTGTPG